MKQLFLDMDGVLVNWDKGCHELHGLNHMPGGEWPYKFGPEGWHFYRELGMTVPQLFKGQDREFWANLEWMPDGKKILQICEAKFGDNICLLTSPHDADGVIDGRKDWIKKHMPHYTHRHLIGDYKNACAHGESVLVDDCQGNITSWQEAEGIGVMVPRPYNSQYKLRKVAAEMVEQRLHKIVRNNNE